MSDNNNLSIQQHHLNTGSCKKCLQILQRFPNFHEGLKNFFLLVTTLRTDAHISCAGRGKAEQEQCFKSRTSRAHWGQSAHNYNAALDFFRLVQTGISYDEPWFRDVIGKAVVTWNATHPQLQLEWYGAPGAVFSELPHVQVANWRSLNRSLVE